MVFSTVLHYDIDVKVVFNNKFQLGCGLNMIDALISWTHGLSGY